MLSGGPPNSLGRTPEVVAATLADRALLRPLFTTLRSDDPIVRMRAGDALEKVCRERPEWFAREANRLLEEVAAIDQPSVRWHVIQMLGEIRLTGEQHRRAVALARRFLETSQDWIVLNVTMQQLFEWSRDDPTLAAWLAPQLERLTTDRRRSVAGRARKLLAAMPDRP
jgi:hypothetical protein